MEKQTKIGGKMKQFIVGIVLISLIMMSSCSVKETQTPGATDANNEVTPVESGLVKSDLAMETLPQADAEQLAELAEGNTAFASAFYALLHENEGNIIFSPFSISLALSMAMAGAETTTEEVMMNALQMTLPEEEVYPAFNALILALEESENAEVNEMEGSEFTLNIANSLWGQAGFELKTQFLDTLARYFGAGMYTVDFEHAPEAARVAVNEWVADETEDKIKDLIPEGAVNELTRLILANAIYFNGSWMYPFTENATSQEDFTLLDGSEMTVDMMKMSGTGLSYLEGEGFQAVSLPYLSPDFSMLVLLPDEGQFTAFESILDADNLLAIIGQMQFNQVALQMPKFDFEMATNANDVLAELGMGEIFDPDAADFSGITEEDQLYVTSVLHKATITVDESGTEAAAATAVIMGIKSAMPEEPISLIIDRPFLFLIRHEPTGTILFMGRVVEP
jgi:serpin B